MTHEKTIRIISNVLFGIGASLAAAAIIKSVVESASLPPGVCPFDQNRWLTYSALGALAASLILSFVGDFYRRRRKSEGR